MYVFSGKSHCCRTDLHGARTKSSIPKNIYIFRLLESQSRSKIFTCHHEQHLIANVYWYSFFPAAFIIPTVITNKQMLSIIPFESRLLLVAAVCHWPKALLCWRNYEASTAHHIITNVCQISTLHRHLTYIFLTAASSCLKLKLFIPLCHHSTKTSSGIPICIFFHKIRNPLHVYYNLSLEQKFKLFGW